MKNLIIFMILLASCSMDRKNIQEKRMENFSESSVLEELNIAYQGDISAYFPQGNNCIKYNFFLNLEDGYFNTAGNKIHLFADSIRWAIVFEKNGYSNSSGMGEIELIYIGNCIQYIEENYSQNCYISNSKIIPLIKTSEFDRISKSAIGTHYFEQVSPDATYISVRDLQIPIETNSLKYKELKINLEDSGLIGFKDLVRYLNETQKNLMSASEEEIKDALPKDLPLIMTLEKYYYTSKYNNILPSKQKLFHLIAKILVTKDKTLWISTEDNNEWFNWDSGFL